MISPSRIQEKNKPVFRGIQAGFFTITAVPCALGIVFCALHPLEVNQVLGTDGFMLPIIVLGFGFLYSVAATGLGFGEPWQAGASLGFLLSKAVFFLLQWAGLVGGMFCGIMTAFAVAEAVVGRLGEVLGYLLIAGMIFLPGIGLGFLLPLAWTCCFKGAEHEREAIGYHKQALAISQNTGRKMEANFHWNSLGAIYGRLGQYDKALDCHEQALGISSQAGYQRGMANDLVQIGEIHKKAGRYDQAIAYHQKALETSAQTSLKIQRFIPLISLGTVYQALGRHDKAIDCYERASTLAHADRSPKKEAEALALLGSVYRDLAQDDKANAYDKQALKLDPEIGPGPGALKAK